MKTYQKAEMIAKNLPTGSYAAGCPTGEREGRREYTQWFTLADGRRLYGCQACEVAQ